MNALESLALSESTDVQSLKRLSSFVGSRRKLILHLPKLLTCANLCILALSTGRPRRLFFQSAFQGSPLFSKCLRKLVLPTKTLIGNILEDIGTVRINHSTSTSRRRGWTVALSALRSNWGLLLIYGLLDKVVHHLLAQRHVLIFLLA